MSTTKIIKGYANPNDGPDVILWHEQQTPIGEHSPTIPATLYIGPGKVWTEDEVMAYEKDLIRAMSDPGSFTERHREMHHNGGHYSYEETVPQWVSRARSIVRSKHGLTL